MCLEGLSFFSKLCVFHQSRLLCRLKEASEDPQSWWFSHQWSDFQVEIHLALEQNRRKIQESVLLSNVHKYFFLPITMFQISGKNFELKCWFPNLSKYLWKSSLILKFSSFHQRFLLYCWETMIFIQIFDKYWFENLKESCKMTLFSLKFH